MNDLEYCITSISSERFWAPRSFIIFTTCRCCDVNKILVNEVLLSTIREVETEEDMLDKAFIAITIKCRPGKPVKLINDVGNGHPVFYRILRISNALFGARSSIFSIIFINFGVNDVLRGVCESEVSPKERHHFISE